MPFAVTHVILTIVIADIYRDYFAKKKFPMSYVFIAGIAGLLPDLDIPIGWVVNFFLGTNYNFHRLYSHSLNYSIIFLLLALVFLFLKGQSYKIMNWKLPKQAIVMSLFAMSFGWFMHIFLDCMLAADGYLNFIPSVPLSFCPSPFSNQALLGFDAIILVLWLFHEQWKHEIKDYI